MINVNNKMKVNEMNYPKKYKNRKKYLVSKVELKNKNTKHRKIVNEVK